MCNSHNLNKKIIGVRAIMLMQHLLQGNTISIHMHIFNIYCGHLLLPRLILMHLNPYFNAHVIIVVFKVLWKVAIQMAKQTAKSVVGSCYSFMVRKSDIVHRTTRRVVQYNTILTVMANAQGLVVDLECRMFYLGDISWKGQLQCVCCGKLFWADPKAHDRMYYKKLPQS